MVGEQSILNYSNATTMIILCPIHYPNVIENVRNKKIE